MNRSGIGMLYHFHFLGSIFHYSSITKFQFRFLHAILIQVNLPDESHISVADAILIFILDYLISCTEYLPACSHLGLSCLFRIYFLPKQLIQRIH